MPSIVETKRHNPALYERFRKAALERHRNPDRLLRDYMAECLEIWGDEQLDQEIADDVTRSGLHEEEVVDFVRQVRREMRERRAAS